jgi:hypothetical protein
LITTSSRNPAPCPTAESRFITATRR